MVLTRIMQSFDSFVHRPQGRPPLLQGIFCDDILVDSGALGELLGWDDHRAARDVKNQAMTPSPFAHPIVDDLV